VFERIQNKYFIGTGVDYAGWKDCYDVYHISYTTSFGNRWVEQFKIIYNGHPAVYIDLFDVTFKPKLIV